MANLAFWGCSGWYFDFFMFVHRFFSRNLKPVPDHKTRRCVEFVPQVSFKEQYACTVRIHCFHLHNIWVASNSHQALRSSTQCLAGKSPTWRVLQVPLCAIHTCPNMKWSSFMDFWRSAMTRTHSVCYMRWQTTRKTLTCILITIFVYGNRQSLPITFTNGEMFVFHSSCNTKKI